MATPSSQTLVNWAAIRSLAPDRFDAYVKPNDTGPLDAIARYAWNLAVSSRFYLIFHAVEIAFRNQLHNALEARHGTFWYDTVTFLNPVERKAVAEAKSILSRQKKPVIPGRVVAELNFGFWTQLYGSHHEHDIVRPTIRQVFPFYSGASALKRAVVAAPLRQIRLLRNRIAHHEHIVFDPNIAHVHAQAFQLVQWMNPQLAELAAVDDDALAIYGRTWQAYRPIVEQLFG